MPLLPPLLLFVYEIVQRHKHVLVISWRVKWTSIITSKTSITGNVILSSPHLEPVSCALMAKGLHVLETILICWF
ncbi:unnamed protein product [Trifolium pratense]|uniref:Uncharacterized protein n=1 Tax=Trifolium pratense TaxID=57577 RepID=A0ACB0JMP5_TRIPR|nr:unnamed protein product [Trifolium pratense]